MGIVNENQCSMYEQFTYIDASLTNTEISLGSSFIPPLRPLWLSDY